MLFPLTLTSILIILAIILVSCLFVARYRDIYEKIKIPLAVITFVGGLIIYTVGYLPEGALQKGIGTEEIQASISPDYGAVTLRALFSTCRIFVLENDFSEVSPAAKSNQTYVLLFAIIHATALIITVLTLLSLFGFRFISRIQLFFSRSAETYIFFGLNEPAYRLIKNMRSCGKKRCIIVVENAANKREEEQALAKKIRENRCILIDRDPYEIDSFGKLRLPKRLFRKKINAFLMSDYENANIKTAISLIKSIKRDKISCDKLILYIQSASEDTSCILETACRENGVTMEFKIFNVSDLIARQLMEICPIVDTMKIDIEQAVVKSNFNLFIAGFGPLGTEILRKCLYNGQFVGGNFKAIITDSAMNSKEGTFNNRYDAINRNYSVQFVQAEPGSLAFYDVLTKHIHELNYIVVALDNDLLSMETAIEIQRLIKRNCPDKAITLAVRITDRDEYARYENSAVMPNIHLFGGMPDIFTESIIINESMDVMARTVNTLYNRIYNVDPADNWQSVDAFTKESNRSAAMNMRTKLRLLGLEMTKKGAAGEKAANLDVYLAGQRLENLAKQEHMRWNAFHFASGWTTWELPQTDGAKKAKDSANKRHACLVPWEKLKDVTERFQQIPSYEGLDFFQVRHITAILDAAGFTVNKI